MSHRYRFDEFMVRYFGAVECPLSHLLDSLPKPGPDGPWIAGGAIRRTVLGEPLDSDVDYFFRDQEQAEQCVVALKAAGARQSGGNEHTKNFLLTVNGKDVKAQVITLAFYPTPEAVIDSFDFTITQFAYDGTHIICGEFSMFDLARKRLALHRLTYGASTVRRLIKYTRQGFTACGGCLADILEKAALDPSVIHRETPYVD